MRFSFKQLVPIAVVVGLCVAWWSDRRKLENDLATLNTRENITVVDMYPKPEFFKFVPSFSLSDSAIASQLEWTDPDKEPPITAADIRNISETIISEMKACKGGDEYVRFWLDTAQLVPFAANNENPNLKNRWCYFLDFSGEKKSVRKSTITKNGGYGVSPIRGKIFRAIVLMDGTIHTSPQLSDEPFRTEMALTYPSQPNSNPEYVIRGIKQLAGFAAGNSTGQKQQNNLAAIKKDFLSRIQQEKDIMDELKNLEEEKKQAADSGNPD